MALRPQIAIVICRRVQWPVLALGLVVGLCFGAARARADDPAPGSTPPRSASADGGRWLPLRIGSKALTESIILGEMLCHLARATGLEAEHRRELSGTRIAWGGLTSGELDAYPEYTGTLLREIFPHAVPPIRTDDELRAALAERGLGMTERLGFNNSYALGVRQADADRFHLRTISDLARHPRLNELRFGLSDEFVRRPDGWAGLRVRYGLPGSRVRNLDHGLAFRAMESGSIDVMDLCTTDAEIAYHDLVALVDDRGYFPQYDAVILYRLDLQERAPAAVAAFARLAGRLSNPAMVELNRRAKIDRLPEADVAADFLRDALELPIAASGEDYWSRFLQYTGEHLFLVAVSLSLAIAVAIPLGILAHRYPTFGQGTLAVVGVIQTVPALAVLVFVIPLLGLGAWPAIVALFLYSLLPIVRGTYTGLREIPPQVHESAEVLGLPGLARLRLVEMPLASPSILSGIKTAAVINIGTATIGALIGAGGYGQPILSGIRLDRIDLILQGAVPAALLAIGAQFLFELAERWLVPAGLRVEKA